MHGEPQTRDPSQAQSDGGSEPLPLSDLNVDAAGAVDAEPPRSRSLAPLRMVFGAAAQYPRQIAFALGALVITSAATLAIPWRFKVIVDEAFGGTAAPDDIARAFEYLLMIVVVLGIGTALRFYFVSWLGERVVADIRLKVQHNLLRLSPGFYEVNSPKEIASRMTSDTAIIEIQTVSGHGQGLLDPFDTDPDDRCTACTGALRNARMHGLPLLQGLHIKDGRWQGQILDPDSGRLYRLELERRGDELRVTAIALFGLFHHHEIWRAEAR